MSYGARLDQPSSPRFDGARSTAAALAANSGAGASVRAANTPGIVRRRGRPAAVEGPLLLRRDDERARRSAGMCAGERNCLFFNFFFGRDMCGQVWTDPGFWGSSPAVAPMPVMVLMWPPSTLSP